MRQRAIAAALLCAVAAACGGRRAAARDSAGGAMAGKDSAIDTDAGITPAAGPVAHVTKTDGKSVALATKYEITDANFRKYMAASESLSVLRARDPEVKRIADNPYLSGAGSPDVNAGLKLLESNAAISKTINDAGISVPDYFVMSIAIASAERFMKDPKAAPPTPTLSRNAEYLRAHQSDLLRLDALSAGPAVEAKSS